MILITGKIFRKNAWRVYDTNTKEHRDTSEINLKRVMRVNKDFIENAILAYGKLRGREYMLNRLGFVGRSNIYIIIDRIIEDNKIIGLNAVNTDGRPIKMDLETYKKLSDENKIVNNHIRWE